MGDFTKKAEEFSAIPIVQEHVSRAGAAVGRFEAENFTDEIGHRMLSNYDGFGGELAFDSPLEVVFWIWWKATIRTSLLLREKAELRRHVFVECDGRTFNIDFVVKPTTTEWQWPLVGVELDGHAFHEKTLEQVTVRNQRDRSLQQAGWRIFHFSFEELTKRPEESLFELIDYITEAAMSTRAAEIRAKADGAYS